MYLPAHFNESRTEILQQCIARHPFGTLITHGKGGLDANHLPFELAAHEGTLGVLRAHVARANPLWAPLESVLSKAGAAGEPPVDPALRDYILLITILVAFLEATAQQLRPYQPPVVMGFSGVIRQEPAG